MPKSKTDAKYASGKESGPLPAASPQKSRTYQRAQSTISYRSSMQLSGTMSSRSNVATGDIIAFHCGNAIAADDFMS